MKISSLKHLAYILKCKTSENEINEICFHLSRDFSLDHHYYREKREESVNSKGKQKIRIINPSKKRLKHIQAAIKRNILDQIELPDYIQGGRKGCSNITNAVSHLGNQFKFTTDISKFFPSITPKQVYKAFCEQRFVPDISRALTMLCTYKGKVPQGASTSSKVADLVFLSTDYLIHEQCIALKLKYTRYVDDISISGKVDFKAHVDSFIQKIEAAGFRISRSKTFYRKILEITGIEVKNNGMKPNEKFYKKLDQPQTDVSRQARMAYLRRVKTATKR